MKEEGYSSSELGNWNSAREFSRVKIMNCLERCETYENIAEYGYDSLMEEIESPGIPTDTLRLMGLKRLIKELIKVIKNSKFALKKEKTKDKAIEYEEQLTIILEKIYPTLSITITNQRLRTKETMIVQARFDVVLKTVLDIKSNINDPLNKNNLIFVDKDQTSIKEKKRILKESFGESN